MLEIICSLTAAPTTCDRQRKYSCSVTSKATEILPGFALQQLSTLSASSRFWAASRQQRPHLSTRRGLGTHLQFSLVKVLWVTGSNWTYFCSGVWDPCPVDLWCLRRRRTWQYMTDTSQHCLFGFALTPHSGIICLLLETFPRHHLLTLDLK